MDSYDSEQIVEHGSTTKPDTVFVRAAISSQFFQNANDVASGEVHLENAGMDGVSLCEVNTDTSNDLLALEETTVDLFQRISDAAEKASKLEKERDLLKANNDMLLGALCTLQEENDSLRTECSTLRASVATLTDKLAKVGGKESVNGMSTQWGSNTISAALSSPTTTPASDRSDITDEECVIL